MQHLPLVFVHLNIKQCVGVKFRLRFDGVKLARTERRVVAAAESNSRPGPGRGRRRAASPAQPSPSDWAWQLVATFHDDINARLLPAARRLSLSFSSILPLLRSSARSLAHRLNRSPPLFLSRREASTPGLHFYHAIATLARCRLLRPRSHLTCSLPGLESQEILFVEIEGMSRTSPPW